MRQFTKLALLALVLIDSSASAQPEAADALAKRWKSMSLPNRDDAISSAVIRAAQQGSPVEEGTIGLALTKVLGEGTTVSPTLAATFERVLVDLAGNPRPKSDPLHGTVSSEGELLALAGVGFLDASDPEVVRACEVIAERKDVYSFAIRTRCQKLLARGGNDASLRRIAPTGVSGATTESDLVRIAQLSSPTPDELDHLRRSWPTTGRGVRDWIYSEIIQNPRITPERAELYLDMAATDFERGSLLLILLSEQPPHIIKKLAPKFEQVFRNPEHSEKARASALKALHTLRSQVPLDNLVEFFEAAKEERSQRVVLSAALELHPVIEPKYLERMQKKALNPADVNELLYRRPKNADTTGPMQPGL